MIMAAEGLPAEIFDNLVVTIYIDNSIVIYRNCRGHDQRCI
jgi:hypothetical protein